MGLQEIAKNFGTRRVKPERSEGALGAAGLTRQTGRLGPRGRPRLRSPSSAESAPTVMPWLADPDR